MGPFFKTDEKYNLNMVLLKTTLYYNKIRCLLIFHKEAKNEK